MASPYIGEIRMFAGNFAPQGWATCDGQLLAIAENDTLFNLIGTTYGGDGQNTFALPNLAARVPIHAGSNGISTYTLAANGGVTDVTLTTSQMPVHSHSLGAISDNATVTGAAGNLPAQTPTYTPYIASTGNVALASAAVTATGGSQPHSNLQPFLTITFIIALYGVYPSPT